MVSRGRICRGGLRSDGAVGRIQCPKAADYVVTSTPNQVGGMSHQIPHNGTSFANQTLNSMSQNKRRDARRLYFITTNKGDQP